jgi:hypothetical protein
MDKHSHTPRVWKYLWAASLPGTRARVINGIDFTAEGGCWNWTGAINDDGYSMLKVTESGVSRLVYVHRLALHLAGRPVPEGLTVDHRCRNRRCVNPLHLDQVTLRENLLRGEAQGAINARKTHCHKGHEYDERNTAWYTRKGASRPYRRCRTCQREQQVGKRVKAT